MPKTEPNTTNSEEQEKQGEAPVDLNPEAQTSTTEEGEAPPDFDPYGPEPTPGLGNWLGSLLAGAAFGGIGFVLWLVLGVTLPWVSAFPILIMAGLGSLALRVRLGRPHPILLSFSLALAVLGSFTAIGTLGEIHFRPEMPWWEALDLAWSSSMLRSTLEYLSVDGGRPLVLLLLDWLWVLGGYGLAFFLPLMPEKYLEKLRPFLPLIKAKDQ
jgi:hypothetical protein